MRGEGKGSAPAKRKSGYFPCSVHWERALTRPPSQKPERAASGSGQRVLLSTSQGYRSAPEFSLLCTGTNTSAQRPNAVCPLGLAALPVGKPKPGSCQLQLRLRPCGPIKEALLVKGRPLFPKQGKQKKKKGLCSDWGWQLSLARVFKEL